MSEKQSVINVSNVSKNFRLPHQKTSSVKDLFVHPVRSLRGAKTANVQHALHDINFEIKEGEFFGIVGRNGSGKSTLLKILAGIYQPTKGKVSVKGKLVPFIELGVGFNPELTGRENVYLSGALNGFSDKEVDDMYEDIVEFAELEEFMDQKLKNYSSGMQVRLAFSVAIRSKADILLIDEVLAVGDIDFQRKCYRYFKSLKKDKKTVVFVSHDMSAIKEYCDKAILIEKSKIIAEGGADEVARHYLKLFAPSSDTKASVDDRWGDRKAFYADVSAEVFNGQKVLIAATVECREDVSDPVVGFSIVNSAGQPLVGTNTQIQQLELGGLKKGQKRNIEWTIPNIFSNGRHTVELTISYNDMTIAADWWEDAATFEVKGKTKTPYVVNPNVEFSQDAIHDNSR